MGEAFQKFCEALGFALFVTAFVLPMAMGLLWVWFRGWFILGSESTAAALRTAFSKPAGRQFGSKNKKNRKHEDHD